jgi:hypothetical protein
MTQRNRKFSISIDFDAPDAGYSVLKSKRMVSFLLQSIQQGYNLIHTYKPFCAHQTTLHLTSKKVTSWPKTPSWDEILCKSSSDWLKEAPCEIGTRKKIFVKYKSNKQVAGFGIYLWMILGGEITEPMHKEFVKRLQYVFKKDIIIHNEDVDWFHLKDL